MLPVGKHFDGIQGLDLGVQQFKARDYHAAN